MAVDLVRNIDLLQINIKAGVSEYFLPKNVSWRDKVIDKMLILTDNLFNGENHPTIYSPTDGVTPLLKYDDIVNLYADIYTTDSREIAHGLSVTNIHFRNNNPWFPNVPLDLQQSRLYFSTPPTKDGCILLYVFYDGCTVDLYEPSNKNITVKFTLQPGQEVSFADVINTYVHVTGEKIRSIQFVRPEDNPAYVTFRDYKLSYIINNVCNYLMRMPFYNIFVGLVWRAQARPILFDQMDIDFDNSYIRNAMNDKVSEQTIIFEY